MIVRLTLNPDETVDPMDIQDIGHALTALGFHVDFCHADKIHDSDEFAAVIARYNVPMANSFVRQWEADH